MKLKEIGAIVLGNQLVQSVIEGLAEKGAEVGKEAAEKALKEDEEWRDEMYGHWHHTRLTSTVEKKREGAENLIRQHKIRSNATDGDANARETKMMHTLSMAWKHMEETPKIRDNFFYLGLGQMDDTNFEVALDALHDDKIMQWISLISKIIERGYLKAEEWAVTLFNRVLDALAGHKHVDDTRDKILVILGKALEIADNTAALAFDVADIGLDAVNEGLDNLKKRGGLWNRLID